MADDAPNDKASSGSWQESFRDVAPYIGLGTQMVITMMIFVGAGYFLDQRLGTTPWLLLAGTLLGMVVVFIYLVRIVGQLNKKADERQQQRDEDASTPSIPPG